MLFDTHCHLDVEDFDPDRAEVAAAARAAGVTDILVPGIHRAGWARLEALCAAAPGLHAALGLHPVHLHLHADADVDALRAAIDARRPAAVGEIGLDYAVDGLDRARQQRLFEAQLDVAREAGLPAVLHVRKAHDAALAVLARMRVRGGIAHAFNGSADQGRRYADLGFRLGFGGMLTYARSRRLHALARTLPIQAIVLETDAPDLTPAAHHGCRNSPAYLPEVLAALAQLRGEDPVALAAITTANARAVLDLAAPA
ncbi:MAG: TatD family hydrolase [Gammaproteobacteria bacterium]